MNFIPHKHILFSESLLAIAGTIRLSLLETPKTIDELWIEIKKDKNTLMSPNFSQMILSVNLLFAINQLYINEYSQLAIVDLSEDK